MQDLHQERRLGRTPEQRQVNELLLALSRSARAFRLYDPRNALIRTFLTDLRERFQSFGREHGALSLEIEDVRILWQEQVVYEESDRERSLAFRLFRDGVRGLEFGKEVRWDELVSLLEVLSIRYVGVRQSEHDVVTLLRAADFRHIEVHAVEGALDAAQSRRVGPSYGLQRRFEAPDDFDLPLPLLHDRAPVEYAAVPWDRRHELIGEVESARVPELSLTLTHRMLVAVRSPSEPTRLEELEDLFGELRDYHVIEGRYDVARELYRMLVNAFPSDPDRGRALKQGFHSRSAVRALLRGAPEDGRPSQELLAYLSVLKAPSAIAEGVVAGLALERTEPSRRLAIALLKQLMPHFEGRVSVWLAQAEAAVARDLVEAASEVLPGVALAWLSDQEDTELLVFALERMRGLRDSAELTQGLLGLLESPLIEVRLHAIEELRLRSERSAFDPLMELAERRAPLDLSEAEATAIARAMASLLPEVAAEEFQRWLGLSGVMGRLVKSREHRLLEWAAVSGFVGVDHARYDRDLMELARREKRGPLHDHCHEVLVERRRRRRGEP